MREYALLELEPPFSASLPFTRYFELHSRYVGARFAVWVTVPGGYIAHPERRYPSIYLPDGNMAVPQTAATSMLELDPIHPIRPFIHVGVGYAGEDAQRQLAVRARDLVPPGEPMPPGVSAASMQRLVRNGVLDQRGAQLYMRNLRAPAADRFLSFLEEELHPRLVELFRIDAGPAGLFGYSFGGLFAVYVVLRCTRLFQRVGAGSPGIISSRSRIFEQYEAEFAADTDYHGRQLHLTVCASELSGGSYYRRLVGAGTAQLLALAHEKPLRGLDFSSRIIDHESHASGFVPSWFSFLRTCYPAAQPTCAPGGTQ